MTTFFSLLAARAARYLPGLLAAAALLTGCKPELDSMPKATAGTADFSRYISVGNSLTAGFEDNGLYREGQLNSYPSMLAQQMALAGGGSFTQPLFPEAQPNGSGYLRLTGFDATGSPVLVTVADGLALRGGLAASGEPLLTKYGGEINNLGVPGLRMSQIEAPGLGDASTRGPYNPLYERLIPDGTPSQSYLKRVAAARPTFFTCWLGNNDVLGYATSGGALAELQPASYGLTDTASFGRRARKLIDTLTVHGAKGVVGLIPNVTAIPFFTTVGAKVQQQLAATHHDSLIAITGPYNVVPGPATNRRKRIATADIMGGGTNKELFTLTGGAYVSLIGQPSGQYWYDFYRQLAPGLAAQGLVITYPDFKAALRVDTTQAFGVSDGNPWPTTLLLDDEEQVSVQDRTRDFNNILRAKALAKGLAVFDAYTFFNGIAAQGLATSGVSNSTSYITGNLFSLDGVHPAPRGYAVVANELLRIINEKYGATLPYVDPGQYRGVKLP